VRVVQRLRLGLDAGDVGLLVPWALHPPVLCGR
jgi:hypothetical protein